MKNLYYIGLGPGKFVSAELRTYHKGWMITRIFVPEEDEGKDYDIQILQLIMNDADTEGVILYLNESMYKDVKDKNIRYVPYGFQIYKGVPRRRPERR